LVLTSIIVGLSSSAIRASASDEAAAGADELQEPKTAPADLPGVELDLEEAAETDARLRPPNPAYEDSTLIATVGNDRVTAGDLYYARDYARGVEEEMSADSLRASLVTKAINLKLLAHEARRLGFERSPALVNTMAREEEGLIGRELVRRIYAGKLHITNEEILELYDRYFYTLRVLHLSVTEQGEAERLRARILAGENFGDLARLYSEDKKSAPQGGDLGEVRAGRMIILFEDAVFALEPGQVSEVIKGQGEHYKIFQLISKDRDRDPSRSYDEMRPALRKRVRTRKAALVKYEWEQSLVAKYNLQIDPENYPIFSHRLRDQIASWEAINSIRRDSLTTAWIFTDWPPEEVSLPIARWQGGQLTCAEFNKVSKEMTLCPTCLWRDSDVQLRMFVLGRAFDRLFELEQRAIRLEKVPHITIETKRRREARLGEMVAASLVVSSHDVSDADARAYWEGHRNDYLRNRRGRVRHIVVETEDQAAEIVERLRGGADFAALAKRYSKDETTNWNGGQTDWFTPGSMHGMADVALAHPVGELIPPFKSQAGWEVVEVLEKEPATPMSFEEAELHVKQKIAGDRTQAALTARLAEIEKSTRIGIDEAALARLNFPS
jgi:parvulin-like peptidyl-prolyl isomerase